jgi:hypothetical protein
MGAFNKLGLLNTSDRAGLSQISWVINRERSIRELKFII